MRIAGWVTGPARMRTVRVAWNHKALGHAALAIKRPDVAHDLPKYPDAGDSGFILCVDKTTDPGDVSGELSIVATTVMGETKVIRKKLWAASSKDVVLSVLSRRDDVTPHEYVEAADSLAAAGRPAEAEAVLVELVRIFPHHFESVCAFAWRATRRGDWPLALSRWEAVRREFSDRPEGHVEVGVAQWHLNQLAEAEQTLKAAIARFPGEARAYAFYAMTPVRRRDWVEATSRWEVALRKFPDDPTVREGYAAATHGMWMDCDDSDISHKANQTSAMPATHALSDAQLMLRFESLGFNCDFGMAQRHYGSEPLGLLRFSHAPLESLIPALDARFEGVGSADTTELKLVEKDGDYWLTDTRYKLSMHTNVYPNQLDIGEAHRKLLNKHCRRLEYLKNKLLCDLDNQEKILVYHHYERLTDFDIFALFSALRKYGPNVLLCVRPSDKERPTGTVEVLQPGLMVGYIVQPIFPDIGSLPYESWLRVCRGAGEIYERWRREAAIEARPSSRAIAAA